jgi:hypothetical protein
MFKKLLVFICLLSLASCNSDTVVMSKDEYNRLKNINPEYPKLYTIYGDYHNYDWRVVLGQDGHEYLENDGGHYVFIHFPSCVKCINDTSRYR